MPLNKCDTLCKMNRLDNYKWSKPICLALLIVFVAVFVPYSFIYDLATGYFYPMGLSSGVGFGPLDLILGGFPLLMAGFVLAIDILGVIFAILQYRRGHYTYSFLIMLVVIIFNFLPAY